MTAEFCCTVVKRQSSDSDSSSFSYPSGTSLDASAWQTWTWRTHRRRSIWKAGPGSAGSCAPAGEAFEWRSSGKSNGVKELFNQICLLLLSFRFHTKEINSYGTFPALTLPLPLGKKLLNVVWMKPGRGRNKSHDKVLQPKARTMLTLLRVNTWWMYSWVHSDIQGLHLANTSIEIIRAAADVLTDGHAWPESSCWRAACCRRDTGAPSSGRGRRQRACSCGHSGWTWWSSAADRCRTGMASLPCALGCDSHTYLLKDDIQTNIHIYINIYIYMRERERYLYRHTYITWQT